MANFTSASICECSAKLEERKLPSPRVDPFLALDLVDEFPMTTVAPSTYYFTRTRHFFLTIKQIELPTYTVPNILQ